MFLPKISHFRIKNFKKIFLIFSETYGLKILKVLEKYFDIFIMKEKTRGTRRNSRLNIPDLV